MGCCQSLQKPPKGELKRHRLIYARLAATAEELGKHQELRDSSHDTRIPFDYIAFGGQYCTHTFGNTCVLDSLLAGCHIAAIEDPNIRGLFMQDQTINAVMTLLDSRKYVEAKALWLINLDLRNGCIKHFTESAHIDIRGYVKDHLPNFLELSCARFHYDEDRRSPSAEDHVYSKTVSKFELLGDVTALGSKSNPQLILVDVDGRINGFPAHTITDDYERKFKLQFLLLGKITANSNHMVLYTRLRGGWWLYDDMDNPLFREVKMEDILTQGYVVHLAAYVNVSTKNGEQD